MKRTWLLFSQVVTVLVAIYFVVATLQPTWLQRGNIRSGAGVSLLQAPLMPAGEVAPGSFAPAARKAFWGAPRAPMTLALSADDGLTWPWQRNLEVGDGWCMSNDSEQGRNREYSYPSLRQDADGTLHLAYTVFRQHIRHVRLQPDWATQHP